MFYFLGFIPYFHNVQVSPGVDLRIPHDIIASHQNDTHQRILWDTVWQQDVQIWSLATKCLHGRPWDSPRTPLEPDKNTL